MRKLVVSIYLLLAGLAVFVLGFPYRIIYPSNSDPVYCVALSAVFLVAALVLNIRVPTTDPKQRAQDGQIVPRQAGRRGTASRTKAALPESALRGSVRLTTTVGALARRSEGIEGLLPPNSGKRR